MGLDMYLNRMPRYKNTTAEQIFIIENYLDWKDAQHSDDPYTGSFEKWCGYSIYDVPSQDVIDFYRPFYIKRYSSWDKEKKYGWARIMEQVGYWRKANAIHLWFVENVQDGEDDCSYHHEVTKETLEKLLNVCNNVLNNLKLVQGKVRNGQVIKDGQWVDILEDGKRVEDASIAEKLLPTTRGFFFGSIDYDEYYVQDLKQTVGIIEEVLATTDFETQMIYYVSSW